MSALSRRVISLICIIAAIGFLFDIYELLMLPLILKDALADLGGVGADGRPVLLPGSPGYNEWARMLFFVPAIAGGVFGLLGGYLTDLFGRRRVLTFSILLYAFSAVGAGLSTSLPMLLFFRSLVFVGVCVEFVAAVAWLAELFDDRDDRERALGYTQAFSSFGGILVAVAFGLCYKFAEYLPAIYGEHDGWRYTLISGVVPALPLIIIRPFLPESPKWQEKRAAGTLGRPSVVALFSPQLLRTTIVTTLMFAASYGLAFGAIQQLPQILGATGKGHSEIMAMGDRAVAEKAAASDAAGGPGITEGERAAARREAVGVAIAEVQSWQEIGGLVGRFALAFLAVRILARRKLFRIFQIPSLLIVPALFYYISISLDGGDLTAVKIGIALAGFFVVAQFSFWGNYIPLVFPLHLRGTGESFAANIGGRILGTAAAFITLTFSASTPPDPAKIAYVGAIVAGVYALVGFVLTFFMPEAQYAPEESTLHDTPAVAGGHNAA